VCAWIWLTKPEENFTNFRAYRFMLKGSVLQERLNALSLTKLPLRL
jgi:hypothetical protein